jgi:hypothetical protein
LGGEGTVMSTMEGKLLRRSETFRAAHRVLEFVHGDTGEHHLTDEHASQPS